MGVFARAFRRAGLPLRMSQGFNPRPRFSLPAPLPVGIEGLEEELRLVARGCPAPILTLAGVGSFPRRGRERVLWVGVREEGEPRLGLLRDGVLDAFAAAGFDPAEERARPFRPHLTVARPRNPRRPRVPASFYEGELEIPWPIETLALVESLRTDGPNRYSAIATFPLPSR